MKRYITVVWLMIVVIVVITTQIAYAATDVTIVGVGSGVTDGDKGDVTVSGSGLVWTIDNSVVTYVKMQNMNTARLLGRVTASAGVVEELTAAQVKVFLGTTFGDITGTATDAQIPNLSSLSTGLTVGRCVRTNDSTGVLEAASADCGVGGGGSSAFNDITGGTNTTAAMVVGTGASLTATGSGVISATTVPDGSVTLAKMANIATDSFIGRDTAGTGVPEVLSVSTTKTVLGLGNVDNTSDATKWTAAKKLENTRIKKRTFSQSDTSPITIDADLYDVVKVAELSQATTFNPPTGTHDLEDGLVLDICTATQRTLTFSTATNGFIAGHGNALPTLTDAGSCVKYLFVWNGSKWSLVGSTQTTVRGTAGQVYTSGGANSEPGWATPPSGIVGSVNQIQLPVGAVNLPTTNMATIDNGETNTRLLFDASTSECAWWGPFRLNSDYASTPVFKWMYSMTSATSGGVSINVSVMAVTPGDSADINTESYDTVNNCDDTSVPGTAGHIDAISCPLTNNDNMVGADMVKVKVCRAVADSADTATGDMEGIAGALEYTR